MLKNHYNFSVINYAGLGHRSIAPLISRNLNFYGYFWILAGDHVTSN